MSPAASTPDPPRPAQLDTDGAHPVAKPPVLRHGLIAAGAALFGNLLVYGISTFTDTPLWVTTGLTASTVSPVTVAIMSVVPVFLGTVLTMLVARSSARAVTVMSWVGLAIGVLSAAMPLALAQGGAKGYLAAMHVVTGIIWWTVLGGAARRRR